MVSKQAQQQQTSMKYPDNGMNSSVSSGSMKSVGGMPMGMGLGMGGGMGMGMGMPMGMNMGGSMPMGMNMGMPMGMNMGMNMGMGMGMPMNMGGVQQVQVQVTPNRMPMQNYVQQVPNQGMSYSQYPPEGNSGVFSSSSTGGGYTEPARYSESIDMGADNRQSSKTPPSNRQPQQPMQQGQVRYIPPVADDKPYQSAQLQEFSDVLDSNGVFVQREYQHFQQAQFLADLCLNYEEISVKRRRVAGVPSVMCESIADITQNISEFMAKAADFEMVQHMLASVAGLASANDVAYDENIVLTKRTEKIEEYLNSMAQLVAASAKSQQPGMVRMDARTLFLSLVKKSLDMFMSKHNQVG